MANRFSVNTILLNKQAVNATGATLLVNGVPILDGISGLLTQTGVALGAQINSVSGWTNTVVSGGLETRLIATGASAVANAVGVGTNLSGNLAATGTRLILASGFLATGDVLTGNAAVAHANSIGQTLSGNDTQSGIALMARDLVISGQLYTGIAQTGSTLDNKVNSLSGFTTGVSGALQALIGAGGGASVAQLNSLSGFTTGVSGFLSARDLAISGALQALIAGGGSQVKVTGSATLATANFTGGGGTTVSYDGTLVTISSTASAAATPTGTYIFRTQVSGGFTKQFINYPIALAANARIVGSVYNNFDNTILPVQISGAISTGFWAVYGNAVPNTGYFLDVMVATTDTGLAATVFSTNNSYSGIVQVSGSAPIAQANIIGIGGTAVVYTGGFISISGAGGGEVSTAQLTGLSGWLTSPPQINLNGGTGLLLNTTYYDTFSANRAFVFSGTPLDSNYISIFALITGYSVLQFPQSYRIGQVGTVTGLAFSSGNHEIQWTYSNGKWWLVDSNAGAYQAGVGSLPSANDDEVRGYAIGSQWITTSSGIYECVNATSGAAQWLQLVTSPFSSVQNSGIVFSSGGILTGDSSLNWDPTNDVLAIGSGGSGGVALNSTSLRLNLGTISGVGIAGKPGLSFSSTGWGNTYYQSAFYDNRTKFISPNSTNTQSIWGDLAANVGTISTVTSEALGDYSLVTPAAGLSAGSSMTTASIYRGSVLGLNGFFFSSKFMLNQAWASGNALGVYGAPSGCRLFVGLTDQAVATQVGLNEPVGSMIGLNYMWASGGAVGTGQYMQNFAIRTRDNVATTTGTTAMSFQTGFYRFSMFCPPFPNNTTVQWELKDLLRGSGVNGTVTTNLPVASTPMRPMVALGFVSGIKTVGFSTLYVEKQGSLID